MPDYTAINLGRLLNDSAQEEMVQAVQSEATEAATTAAVSRVLEAFAAQQTGGGGMILGKVGMTPAGAWTAGKTYERLDVVYSGGGSYVSKHDANQGHPTESGDWWQPLTVPPDLSGLLKQQDENATAIAALRELATSAKAQAETAEKSAQEATAKAEDAAKDAAEAAAALSDFLENERVTGVSYDAGERVLSLARGGENSSLGPLTVTLPVATEAVAGLMGAADKQELKEHDDALRWKKCLTS